MEDWEIKNNRDNFFIKGETVNQDFYKIVSKATTTKARLNYLERTCL
jgi:hypothetical protein